MQKFLLYVHTLYVYKLSWILALKLKVAQWNNISAKQISGNGKIDTCN